MITKEEAINKLKKAGYNVVDDNSVLTIIISEKASIKNTVKNVKELFLKIDYQSSFGVKQHSGTVDEEGNVSDDADSDFAENDEIEDIEIQEESNEDIAIDEVDAQLIEDEPEEKTQKSVKKKATKSSAKAKKADSDDEYLDDEDENFDQIDNIKLDDLDLDMMLNEDSVQFSLEDFGLM